MNSKWMWARFLSCLSLFLLSTACSGSGTVVVEDGSVGEDPGGSEEVGLPDVEAREEDAQDQGEEDGGFECDEDRDCDDGNVCNGEETCDRGRNVCEAGARAEDGTECGQEPRRICIRGACTESLCGDGYADGAGGEECDDGNDAGGDGCDGDCTYSCHEETGDFECDDGRDCTDEVCDAAAHTCLISIKPREELCRASAGDCDPEERCDGAGADCPPDELAGGSTLCRPASGTCDVDEYCTGASAGCPPDAFLPATTVCREQAGPCDVAEHCSGASAQCPEDQLRGGSFPCRPPAGECDEEEFCSGTSIDCPPDAFRPAGAPCDDGDYCTNPDGCDGIGHCTGNTVDELYGIIDITTGNDHTCALLSAGGVKCWGWNEYGQLGDGTTTDRTAPVDVTGLTSGVLAIDAGGGHTCALLSTGGVKCWGKNWYGQLGDGTMTDSAVPVDVAGLDSEVSALSAGWFHTCALLITGEAKCWGYNAFGQLGDGTMIDRANPVSVAGISDVSKISTGGYHTCAVLGTGAVKCWGENWYGQLGDGTEFNKTAPVGVTELSFGILSVSAGGEHTCALQDTGGVKCWGNNQAWQLGDGTTTRRSVPVDVMGLPPGVSAVSAGGYHTCALLDTGRVMCWGLNTSGQTGCDVPVDFVFPPAVARSLESVVLEVDAGGAHTCALFDTESARCWGDNSCGQIGDGTTADRRTPVPVSCQ
jgi:hypothetical protein